ncbi:MAG TPA: protein-disulfide reductase DsbD domain-containing protein, partial [Thermoanaerobaculia bacterium]|nr:protein-disulfide reductase DsbD domain-containing protein [Thermoanaerobaculia bacterium]
MIASRALATTAVLFAVAAAAPPLAAQFAEKGRFELHADRTAYLPGAEVELAAVLRIDRGWHVNAFRPTFDYLIPTELELELPPGWADAEIAYPPAEHERFTFAEEELAVYQGEVVIRARTRVPEGAASGRVPLRAALTYQACDDTQCLPPVTTEQELGLAVGGGGRATAGPWFGGTAAEPAAATGSGNLLLILLLGLVGGLILNAMPCVLPVLSIKVFGLVQSAALSRRDVVTAGLATAAGILASFLALAGAAIAARAAGRAVGWGVQFQEPGFVAFLAVVVVLFSLNMWGLFEIQLPGRLAQLAGGGHHEGVAGHFASGLFATLMATPCSAPFLGTAVGFALAQPPGTILAVFTAVGLGMSLPYLALAAWPRAAGLLPRPGAWMVRLKEVMGFLLAGAAVWLFYVLAAQVTAERLAFVQLALLGLALAVWLRAAAARPMTGRLAMLAVVGTAAA